MLSGANSGEDLKAVVERYRLIFEHAPDAIVILDQASGKFVEANARASAMFEIESGAIQEFGPVILSPERQPDGRPSIEAARDWIGQALDAGPLVFEWMHQTTSGRVFPCEVRLLPIPAEAGRVWLRGSIIDISERKAAERRITEANAELERRVAERTGKLQLAMGQLMRSEKLAALGGLVAGLAHELNTPIGNILGASTALRQRLQEFILEQGQYHHSVTSELSDFLAMSNEAADILARNAERAGDLVASFKQVAVDQTSERWREFNLGQVVEQAIATLRPVLRKRPHAVDIQIPATIEMAGYPGPLEQIVLNLTTNALEHALDSQTAGTIHISARENGDKVHLVFSDEGAGIAPEHIEHIFEPFFTTRLSKGGAGLGLYLVYQLSTGVLEGEIEVRSEPGEGATFEIVLPRRLTENSRVAGRAGS